MVKTQQSAVFDKIGLPIVITLSDEAFSELETNNYRTLLMPCEMETEMNKAVLVQYSGAETPEIQNTIEFSVSKEPLGSLALSFDDPKIVENLVMDQAESVLRTYNEDMRTLSPFFFGKLLFPGEGVQGYELKISGPNADLVQSELFLWTKKERAFLVCITDNNRFDRELLDTALKTIMPDLGLEIIVLSFFDHAPSPSSSFSGDTYYLFWSICSFRY